jgi:23S rRNA (cytosine1962-C5)-methyltransferase
VITPPWLGERVLADDADLIVVDKPSGIVVHGGDELLRGDVVTRVAALLASRGEDDYLAVHQRLDKDASGVLLFVRDRGHNARLARDFETHAARRSYLAAVTDPGLSDRGELEHRLEAGAEGRMRVVARGGKLARSRYRVLERAPGRALVELAIETGRTHQLRVQLAKIRAPIGGDTLYGGEPAERLLLHASSLLVPSLGRSFEARCPERFAGWVRGEPCRLGSAASVRAALADAACRRWPLASDNDAYRLANDLGDGLPGVTLDLYAEFAVLSISSEEAQARAKELADAVVALGARGVFLKLRVRTDLRRADVRELAPSTPLAGEAAPAELEVHEGRRRYSVALADGLSTGLFLDQREGRDLVQRLAGGQRVLNLFCYTCAFSVAAALGGAERVTSVDLSARALERGRQAFVRNHLDPGAHRFFKADVVEWLGRARRRSERYGLVILDPPSFGTGPRASFDIARGYPAVAADALALLEPGGRLLAITNHRKTSRERLRKLLHGAARSAGRRVAQMKDLPSPLDCPPLPTGPHPSKSVLVTLA